MTIPFLKVAVVASLFSLVFVAYLARYVLSKPEGNERMAHISSLVQQGARAFLFREYRYVLGFVIVVSVVIAALGAMNPELELTWRTSVAFAAGALASTLAGFLGMYIATRANARTAAAARRASRC